MTPDTEYDVALSFAGEDREYVARVVEYLQQEGISVFYDRSEEVKLWGKDLAVALDEIYRKKALCVVLFISKAYAQKAWTTFEKGSALAGAIARIGQDFILPARFDDTDIPGLNPNIAYVELRNYTPDTFAALLAEKVRTHETPIARAEPVSLTSLLDGYIQESSFRPQDEVLRALDVRDWPETVSLGLFKSAPKPAGVGELKVTRFKADVLFRITLSTQAEHHFTFKLVTRPSHELRGKYRNSAGSAAHFAPVPFDSRDRHDEHVTGNLTYDICARCEGAGTVAETCPLCAGEGTLEEPSQMRCHRCRQGMTISICAQCGGTGYLDVFPFAGRHVFKKNHILLTGTRSGNAASSTPVEYRAVHKDRVRKALPDQVPFSHEDPILAKRYADVLATERRSDLPPEAAVSRVQDDPFIEKRQMSTYKVYFNGYQFRVDACKNYHISYTREVGYIKGILKKKTVTARIAGSLVILDNGKVTKLADTHQEKTME